MLKVKKAIISRLISKKSRELAHAGHSKDSDKLLFLFAVRDAIELTYYQSILKSLERYKVAYDVLIFAADDMLRKLPVHHPNHHMIFPKDLGMFELPNKEMETKLGRNAYKAVINTYREFLPVLDYAAAAIPSRVRMTRFAESSMPAYNLKIESQFSDNEDEFIEHTIEYINKIK